MTLCGPWVDAGAVTLCDPNGQPDGQFDKAILAASWLLYAATGYRWPGLCTDQVWPGAAGAALQQLQNSTGVGSRPLPQDWDWWGPGLCTCGLAEDPLGCPCEMHSNVHLPGHPIVDIVTIDMDGAPFTGDYTIVDNRWLVRRDGSWPTCQDLSQVTGPGTWSVTYRYGSVPPPPGLIAAEVLACELVASWPPNNCQDCRLPQRLTQATYEGASFSVLDPFSFLSDGRFGIIEVDYFVNMANGGRPAGQPAAKVLSAAEMFGGAHRVRNP